MVDDEVRDGSRIAALLSSEVHGHEQGALGRLSVVDADRDADPTEEGTFAYAVEHGAPVSADGPGVSDGADAAGERASRRIAEVYLHPERIRVEFPVEPEAAVEAAEAQGLRVEAGGEDPRGDHDRPVVAVPVETGAAVKPALRVVRAVAEALDEEVRQT